MPKFWKLFFLILLTSLERGVDKYSNHIWDEETQLLIFYWEIYRVSIKSFPDYKHLLQENYVKYKHIFYHYVS
jgi:hypothetical protein